MYKIALFSGTHSPIILCLLTPLWTICITLLLSFHPGTYFSGFHLSFHTEFGVWESTEIVHIVYIWTYFSAFIIFSRVVLWSQDTSVLKSHYFVNLVHYIRILIILNYNRNLFSLRMLPVFLQTILPVIIICTGVPYHGPHGDAFLAFTIIFPLSSNLLKLHLASSARFSEIFQIVC